MIINKEALLKVFSDCRETAIQFGMYHAITLGYGSFLGMIRDGDFISHDDDGDIIILADKITAEQEQAYYNRLREIKLFNKRDRACRRGDTGRLLWTSMKRTNADTKCCTWYYQRYDRYYFHSKGRNWVEKIGGRMEPPLNPTFRAVMKGIDASLFDHMVEREFQGLKFYIPVMYGSILDRWYPNFSVPKRGGASWEDILLIIPDWANQKSWYFKRRHKSGIA